MKTIALSILALLLVLSFSIVGVSTAEKNDSSQINEKKSPLSLLCIGDESGEFFCGEEKIENQNMNEEEMSTNKSEKLNVLFGVVAIALLLSLSLVSYHKIIK
ncbi:MAG: hypothetical protein ACXAC2_05830 [Candidatus Kariarchaeaceae archaeon]|jgi:hypothetical protein